LCLELAPEVFDLAEDETAFCTQHPDPAQLAVIKAAVAACPRQAITYEHSMGSGKDAT
jgi:ferredoxin